MKTRIPVYLAALTGLIVLTAGDASAFNRIGGLHMVPPPRVAPQPYQPIRVFKPAVSHPIKIGKPEYVVAPRR
jgi:hypothetical protein